jgi:hypothetical protein
LNTLAFDLRIVACLRAKVSLEFVCRKRPPQLYSAFIAGTEL